MWTALKQDAVTRITVLVTAAMTLPYLMPILSPAQLAEFAEQYQLFVLISLVILALTFSVRQGEPAEEKRFWAYFTVAFLFLLVSELYHNLPLQVRFTPSGRLAMDGFYARVLRFRSGTFADLFWFLPFLMMIVTARLRNVLAPAAQGTRQGSPLLTRPRVFGPLTCYAFAVPVIHFGFYAFGLLDASSRPARELLVLVTLVVLVSMALGQQRLLGKKNQSLQSELWRMAAIVESSDDAILSADSQDSIVTWNSGAVGVYGYFSDEIKGKPLALLFPSGRASESRQILERVRDGQQVHHHETQHVRKDGVCIDVSWTLSPIRDSGGRISGVSAIARDITAQRLALVREEREKTARTLLQMLWHDVNNPLAEILGNLSLLKGDVISPAARGCLDEMQASAEKIRSVLGRLRNPDLSQAESGSGV